MSKLKLSAQEGRALALTLVALAIGCLLIPPFLSYISTNLLACRATEEGMKEQYAADAGVEYGIGKLARDPTFLESMLTVGATATLTLPTPVNNMSPTITVANTGTEYRAEGTFSSYVMWANSTECHWGIDATSSSQTYKGDVHTNSDVRISGSGAKIEGILEYVKPNGYDVPDDMEFEPPENNPRQVEASGPPITFTIEDYRPGGQMAIAAEEDGGKYYEISSCGDDCWDEFGVYQDGNRSRIPDGLYYVASGDVCLSHSNITGTVTIVAEEGKIDLTGSGRYLSPYCSYNLLLFSNKQFVEECCDCDVIHFSGSGATMMGIVYGLGGRIHTESSGKFVSCIVGNTIKTSGSGQGIGAGGIGTAPPCLVFDITSVADDTTTAARIVLCSGTAYVVSWEIE